MSNQILSYHLDANTIYQSDKPIIIKFSLINCSEKNIWVLNWYTPLEGLKGKILRIRCNGKEIPYEGPMVKRGNPIKENYFLINPNKSATKELNISEFYKMPIAEKCEVEFIGRIHDFAFAESAIPRKLDEFQSTKITGNKLGFQIVSSPLN